MISRRKGWVSMTEMAERGPEFDKLLLLLVREGGTDLFLEAGVQPVLLVAGAARAVEMCPLSRTDLEGLLGPVLTEAHRRALRDRGRVGLDHAVRRTGAEFHIVVEQAAGRLSVSAARR